MWREPDHVETITPPADLVGLALVKMQRRFAADNDDENELLTLYASTASSWIQGVGGVTGRVLTEGAFVSTFSGVRPGDRLFLGLVGRVAAIDGINGEAAVAPVRYLHGAPFVVASRGVIDGDAGVSIGWSSAEDAARLTQAQALAMALISQLSEYREETITGAISANPAVTRLTDALRARWVA